VAPKGRKPEEASMETETSEIRGCHVADHPQEMMNYRQTADLIGIKLGTLYSMVSRREVPHVRVGRRLIRFPRTEMMRWLAERTFLPQGGVR